jgi:catechol 2,3-dioxygenase
MSGERATSGGVEAGSGRGAAAPLHRLPTGTRVGAVWLTVADATRSVDFYGSVLGLEVLAEENELITLGPPAGPALIHLREVRGMQPVAPRSRLGLFHFAVLLPDRSSLGRFLRHANALRVPLGASDHLVSEALYLNDPDGLGIEVYADRPRAGWRRDGRQVAMATEPLDTASLLEAAGDEPWTGAPSGTVMGHVHLHVGDLDRAREFYHGGVGLDLTSWSYPGALFLSAGGYHHHLGVNTWASAVRPRAGQAALALWEIVVPTLRDVHAAVDGLDAMGEGGVFQGERWLGSDPWGTQVAIRAEDASDDVVRGGSGA